MVGLGQLWWRGRGWLAAVFVATGLAPGGAWAEHALVAVAANFAAAMEHLQRDFEAVSGHRLTVTSGSTGKLYAQLSNGAPYDVLLAADQWRPRLLEEQGFAVEGSGFTYALGHLSLWSPDPQRIGEDGPAVLAAADFRHLAMANPDVAPYGAAAQQVLVALGLYETLQGHIVVGENVAQAYAMVATGNAELGLVARSDVTSSQNSVPGSRWDVPADLHDPIRQDAVLLRRAEDNPGARDFLAYLRSPEVQELLRKFGYGVP